jgi:hypothetical protein
MLNPRHAPRLLTALMLLALTGSAQAQVGLPGGLRPNVGAGVGGSVSGALDRLDNTLGEVTRPATQLVSDARQLADARLERLGDFLRSHRTTVEADDTGQPARAHEVLLLSPMPPRWPVLRQRDTRWSSRVISTGWDCLCPPCHADGNQPDRGAATVAPPAAGQGDQRGSAPFPRRQHPCGRE